MPRWCTAKAATSDGSDRNVGYHLNLPDALAQEATKAGLLAPEKIEHMLRERLRIERMRAARATLAADPLPPMTPEEISA